MDRYKQAVAARFPSQRFLCDALHVGRRDDIRAKENKLLEARYVCIAVVKKRQTDGVTPPQCTKAQFSVR